MTDMLEPNAKSGRPRRAVDPLTPELWRALGRGYNVTTLRKDAIAGLTVAILALPLSMAIATGSGLDPGPGLVTAVVAGFLISAFGGSPLQIGGPAAAFIVVVAGLVAKHGIGGLMTATLLAGAILVVAAVVRLGAYIRYVPAPLVTGFTSGLGILIALAQFKDFFGLSATIPTETIHRLQALMKALPAFNPAALFIGALTLGLIVGLKRLAPRWPGLLIAIVGASLLAHLAKLPVETIGTRFGGIPTMLPRPALPDLSFGMIENVLGAAFTLAFLIGVESLLSAVAADAVAGTRHRPNPELLGQGLANMGSALFGGLPATGVFARTGTNIAAGAETPVSGILHAVFVALMMLLLAPLASYFALPCLAAVLLNVAWRLIDARDVATFLRRAPNDDRLILIVTFLLTVVADLSIAIGVGITLSALLFMHRMSEITGETLAPVRTTPPSPDLSPHAPETRVVVIRGPLFFGVASHVARTLTLDHWPRRLVLDMTEVPLVDATGLTVIEDLAELARRNGCRLELAGLQSQPRAALHAAGTPRRHRIRIVRSAAAPPEKV